jgi:hypothetical protein
MGARIPSFPVFFTKQETILYLGRKGIKNNLHPAAAFSPVSFIVCFSNSTGRFFSSLAGSTACIATAVFVLTVAVTANVFFI